MHQQQGSSDYPSPYYHHPPPPPPSYDNPPPSHPAPPHSYPSPSPPSFASAPPYSDYSQNYPPFPDPTPPPPHFPSHDPHVLYSPPPPPQTTSYYPPYDPNSNYPPNSALSYQNPNPNAVNYVGPYDSNQGKYEHGSGYFDENLSGYGSFGQNKSNLVGGSNSGGGAHANLGGGSGKYEYGSGYFDESLSGYGSFGSSRSNLGGSGSNLGGSGGYDYGKDDGVYAYEGKKEPYGARGTGSSNWSSSGSSKSGLLFDDYGRPIGSSNSEKERSSSGSGSGSGSGALKVVRAVPKAEEKSDGKGGVQKFRVKMLGESGGQGVMDVLCMVGLDGIRMLDPNTSRTLRIYPLDTVTRCDKIDSSTFAFWSKTSVDLEPRRIRLQSNSYTTNTLLDTVTAATVQFKEMGGRARPADPPKALEQSAEKKKGLTDWITKLKPVNEEKDHWVPDEAVSKCTGCGSDFSAFNRRHHCRNCGDVFCDKCTQGRTPLTAEDVQPVRVCDRCMAEVTHRLSKAKEAASRPVSIHSHEDLAKKLQEEMEKNLKISSGSKSEGSGKRMREVACPTCTVHLQVQVPSSGSETIECGVCQHPFLVSAH